MSRCLPYPPPGYVRNGVPGEALIESIKLQNAMEKPKTERTKEKKREKKEKKKDKKRKEVEKSSKIEDSKVDKCKEDLYLKLKGREDESEQVEKSGLTEEHEQPVSSQTLCYLSDSTQSSSKRKRDSSVTSCSQIHGNVLRFRLPSQKNLECNESLGKEQLCSTSGRTNFSAQQKLPDQDQSLNNVKAGTDVKKVTPHSISCGGDNIPAVSGIKSHKDEKRWAELYSLIEDCVPLALHNTEQVDDDDWLFETKHREPKRCRSDNDAWLGGSVSLWPRAYHLPEVEIHALPYTVPF